MALAGNSARLYVGVAIAFAIAAGIFFRFYHVDRKVYWDDEIYTSIRIVGLTETEIVNESSRLTDSAALHELIHPGAHGLRPVGATIASLALEDPQHPPAYYVLARAWAQQFGDSTHALRTLSALIGLATLPCMYFLCRELFRTQAASWVGTAALAIAPISILYAQQAREYVLWTLVTIVVCTLFLRASSRPSPLAWALYAFSIGVSLYVFPLAAIVAVGNFAFALLPAFAKRRQVKQAALATAGGFLLFLPWILTVAKQLAEIRRSMHGVFEARQSIAHICRQAIRLFQLSFFDVGTAAGRWHGLLSFSNLVAGLLMIALVAYLSVRAYRARECTIWPYILMLIVIQLAPFLLADLVLPGNRTGEPRYFMPMYVGIDLALVYLFTIVATGEDRRRSRGILASILAIVVVSRIASCAISSRAETWWTAFDLQAIPIAQTINSSSRPLILSDDYVVWSLVLSNYLKPDVKVQLRPRCYLCQLDNNRQFNLERVSDAHGFSDVFLLGPTRKLQQQVAVARSRAPGDRSLRCINVRNNCRSSMQFWN